MRKADRGNGNGNGGDARKAVSPEAEHGYVPSNILLEMGKFLLQAIIEMFQADILHGTIGPGDISPELPLKTRTRNLIEALVLVRRMVSKTLEAQGRPPLPLLVPGFLGRCKTTAVTHDFIDRLLSKAVRGPLDRAGKCIILRAHAAALEASAVAFQQALMLRDFTYSRDIGEAILRVYELFEEVHDRLLAAGYQHICEEVLVSIGDIVNVTLGKKEGIAS